MIYRECNQAFCEYLGLSRDQIVGRSVYDIAPKGKADVYYQKDLEVLHSGETQFYETGVQFRDGSTRRVFFTKARFTDDKGVPRGLVGTMLDITERIEREQQIRFQAELLDSVGQAVVATDVDGTIRYWNEAAHTLYGWRASEVIGRTVQDVIPVMDTDEDLDLLWSDMVAGNRRQGELTFMRKDRTTFPGYVVNSPWYDDEGELIGMIGVVADITDMKEARDRLEESEQQLRELAMHMEQVRENERTAISRELHDELGQALTALKMDISWLEKHLEQNEANIQSKFQSMIDLIDTTIDSVKRMSAELRPGILDDLGLIDAIEWQIDEFSKRYDIEVEATLPADTDELTKQKSVAVFRILQETLTNVARHAKADSVTVNLNIVDGRLQLEVKDNGRGITAQEIEDTQSFGLIGMQERVRHHGGVFTIEGKPGEGTMVQVGIPVCPEEGIDD
ncbi:PAS domain S-box protein, partial [bacterium]|nr:PAS domain S-box protein [bacterium]